MDATKILLRNNSTQTTTSLLYDPPITVLMIHFKGHYWVDPVDHIDLTAVPLWLRV